MTKYVDKYLQETSDNIEIFLTAAFEDEDVTMDEMMHELMESAVSIACTSIMTAIVNLPASVAERKKIALEIADEFGARVQSAVRKIVKTNRIEACDLVISKAITDGIVKKVVGRG